MKIFYNVKDKTRHELAIVISKVLIKPCNFLYTQTFVYEVGDYRINQTGLLEGPDNPVLVANLNGLHNFIPQKIEYDELDTEDGILTIEMPLDGFTEDSISNLEKLITCMAGFIKKALQIDALPIIHTATSLKFPWFKASSSSEEFFAFAQFVSALCSTAKQPQQIIAKENQEDSENYGEFLTRIGFIGEAFKNSRKVLLRSISGDNAIKDINEVDSDDQ